jgi:serine/threonine-protein kinase
LARGSAVVAAPPQPLWRRAAPIGVAVVATAGVMAFISTLTTRPAASPEVVRFIHVPALSVPLRVSALTSDLTISHDGRTLVYSASPTNGTPLLYVRPIDKLDATALRGAEGGTEPFMSPDDAWVGFVDASSQVQVKKVSIFGGPPVVIANAKLSILGCAWMADGTIVIGSRAGLFSVRDGDASGQQVELTKPDASLGETSHGWPSAIPGTPSVLFATSTGQEGQLAVLDRPGGRIIRLKLAGTKPRYLPSGHIAFVAVDGSLRLVPFDVARLEVTGNPVPADVTVAVKVNGAADFDVSRDGRLIYAGGGEFAAERSIVWVDRSGHETPVGAPMRAYFYARISPDATRLSLDIRDKQSAIWIWDMRGSLTRLTATDGSDQYGLWNPDGQRVIGSSLSGLKNGLFQSRANATGGQEMLLERSAAFPNAVTPDGKTLIFRAPGANGKNDLFAVPMGGDRTAKPLIATEHDELNAAISPDGKWLAYQSDLTGRMEIYVRPFPDVDANQWTISTAGGVKPAWGPLDGELLYLAGDSLMSVRVTPTSAPVTPAAGRGLSVGAPIALFPVSAYFFGGIGRNYDISPDGKRFVMFKNPPTATGGSAPIMVVLNWLEDVKARAPIKK